jgi:hypothetical protein
MNNFLKIFFLILFFGYQSVFALTTPKEEVVKVEVSAEENTESGLDSFESKAKGYFTKTKESLEAFRIKQADHYNLLRDKTKVKLNIQVSEDVFKRLAPMFTPPPAPSGIPGTVEGDGIEPKKIDNPMDYGTLIFATSMASLFSNTLMFYGVLFLLTFIFLRAIFKMSR